MANRNLVAVALGLGVALCAGSAMARDRVDVQWGITIGSHGGAGVYGQLGPVYVQAQGPVYSQPHGPVYRGRHYQHPARWDRDGDGIPNRYDHRYNPRWDRDGDGIPNRYDQRYNPRWDRDGDGVPNRHDRDDDRRQGRGR